ncbi:MAG: type II toxin-antitoxin system prevent-host-death family antitoxin [Thermomicrobiales bacterium]
MVQVNILEARNRLSQLIKAAESGEDVVIANRGVPVARLVGIEPEKKGWSTGATILDWIEKHPIPEHARRSAEEIDRAIQEERDAWE